MTLILVFALITAGTTVWFLARPLRTARVLRNEERDALAQLRDRLLAQLREIDTEAGDRNMDARVLEDERTRLEAELAQVLKNLDASDVAEPSTTVGISRRVWATVLIALAIVLPIASAVLYFGKNLPVLAQLGEASSRLSAPRQGLPPMVLEMVSRLEQRLREQPNDPKGWAQLGRSYAVLERVEEAGQAYARAYELAPEDPEIMSAYGGFLISRSPSKPNAQAVAIFKKLHAQNPNHQGALWALGLIAFQQEDFGQATTYWERLLKQLPPDSEVAVQIRRVLDVAKAQSAKKK